MFHASCLKFMDAARCLYLHLKQPRPPELRWIYALDRSLGHPPAAQEAVNPVLGAGAFEAEPAEQLSHLVVGSSKISAKFQTRATYLSQAKTPFSAPKEVFDDLP